MGDATDHYAEAQALMETIGEQIRTGRRRLGLKQQSLAAEVGLSPYGGMVCQIERGHRLPQEDLLLALCAVLELDPAPLLRLRHKAIYARELAQAASVERREELVREAVARYERAQGREPPSPETLRAILKRHRTVYRPQPGELDSPNPVKDTEPQEGKPS